MDSYHNFKSALFVYIEFSVNKGEYLTVYYELIYLICVISFFFINQVTLFDLGTKLSIFEVIMKFSGKDEKCISKISKNKKDKQGSKRPEIRTKLQRNPPRKKNIPKQKKTFKAFMM